MCNVIKKVAPRFLKNYDFNTNDSEFSGDLKPTTPVRNQTTTPKPYHNGVATTSHGSSSLVASSGLVKPKPHPSSRIRQVCISTQCRKYFKMQPGFDPVTFTFSKNSNCVTCPRHRSLQKFEFQLSKSFVMIFFA